MTDVVDWSYELRKIERQFEGLPAEPTPLHVVAQRDPERYQREVQQERETRRVREAEDEARGLVVARRWTLARLALVALLPAAIGFWPYARDCGNGLYGYMGAEAAIVIGALWVAGWTWRLRMAVSHAVAMTLLIGGLALLTAETLPRIGYAKAAAAWECH